MLRQRVAELEQVQVKMTSGPLQAFPPPVVPMPGIHRNSFQDAPGLSPGEE
jgi:hypothetical protein